jgi:hypothetical protein
VEQNIPVAAEVFPVPASGIPLPPSLPVYEVRDGAPTIKRYKPARPLWLP